MIRNKFLIAVVLLIVFISAFNQNTRKGDRTPETIKTYFDYEKFARDLFMCDYWIEGGFVFRNS